MDDWKPLCGGNRLISLAWESLHEPAPKHLLTVIGSRVGVWHRPACGSAANHQGAPPRPCCHFLGKKTGPLHPSLGRRALPLSRGGAGARGLLPAPFLPAQCKRTVSEPKIMLPNSAGGPVRSAWDRISIRDRSGIGTTGSGPPENQVGDTSSPSEPEPDQPIREGVQQKV